MYCVKSDTGRESQTHREMGTESCGSPAETAGLPPRVGDPVFLLLKHEERRGVEAFNGAFM